MTSFEFSDCIEERGISRVLLCSFKTRMMSHQGPLIEILADEANLPFAFDWPLQHDPRRLIFSLKPEVHRVVRPSAMLERQSSINPGEKIKKMSANSWQQLKKPFEFKSSKYKHSK